MDETRVFKTNEFKDAAALAILKEVAEILKERGYNPINQIVGYLLSGDPGYITSYKDARAKILSIKSSKLLEVIVKESIK